MKTYLLNGLSVYHDAGMTVEKVLFDRKNIQRITIPFDLKVYLKYLDGLITPDVSLKGYSKDFLQHLKTLASMIYYQDTNKKGKYSPPSVKNNSGFSSRVNNTLNQMKQNY